MNYPDPEHNPACQCKDNPLRAFFCQTGHMLECHFPYTCTQASCSHLAGYAVPQDEIDELEKSTQAAIIAGQLPPYQLDQDGNVLVDMKMIVPARRPRKEK